MRCAAAYQKEGNKAMHNKGFEKETFKETVRENIKTLYRKTIDEATPQQIFQAVSYAVKDVIIQNHTSTSEASLIPHRASPEVSRLHPNFLAKLSQNLKSPLQP